jgi:WD40 repeat protein
VSIWSVEARKEQRRIVMIDDEQSSGSLKDIRYTPDGRHIVAALWNSDIDHLTVWDVESGRRVRTYTKPGSARRLRAITSIDVSPDGRLIAATSDDNFLRFWDLASDALLEEIVCPGICGAVAFSPNGSMIAYGSGYDVVIRAVEQ